MSKHIIQKNPKKNFTKESSKEFNNKSDNLESSDNNNDNQKEDMLSKILTRITALENENKTLKAELKNKSSVSSSRNKETSNIIKSSSNKFIQKMDRVVLKLTSKKHAEVNQALNKNQTVIRKQNDWALIYLMHHNINFNCDNIHHQNTNKRRAMKNKPVNKRCAKNNVIYAKYLECQIKFMMKQ
ncbi:hypothetical protein C1646_675659 [Rhizophagus diaphanus]|nr:hypothetical protein C1646_675659 [Rhizophagus diaphanus] [Rhizophagus sp. MUCL 43196]